MNTTIHELGKQCRELAEQGAKLNMEETRLFHHSIKTGNIAMCEALIQTLRDRLK